MCIIAQGSKIVHLENERYLYDSTSFLVASVHLPTRGQITQASKEKLFLGIQLTFDADLILDIMKENNKEVSIKKKTDRGLLVSNSSPELLEAIIKLVRLLDNPEDISVLSPIIIREIFYRVLQSEQGDLIKHFAMVGSYTQSVSKVINLLHKNFKQSLTIKDLAEKAGMGTSTLYRHFKKVTAMSPIQYQKQLRLQEARRLLISESLNAADAAFRVGYESPSQFSREYKRFFGLPPKVDLKHMQKKLI